MAIGDIYQVNIRYTISAQRAITVLHFVVTDDAGAADADKEQGLAEFIADQTNPANFINQLAGVLPEDVTIDQVDAQCISPTRLAYRSAIVALPGTATASNNPAVDVCITKRTDLAGRDQVGTIHQPGIPADKVENGLLAPDYMVDVLDAWDTLMTAITYGDTEWHLCLLHAPGSVPATAQVTNMAVKPEARVMQRRVVGRGI